jgi:exonuclease III
MKLISWNIQGLNGRSKQRLLWERIIAEQPDILLLQETKCAGEEMKQILSRCWKQGQMMTIDARGIAEGLAILWNPRSVIMENFFSTRWTISVEYRLIGSNQPDILTNIYGSATQGDKLNFIQHLERLTTLINDRRWILGGDFNMVCNLEEKKGGIRRLDPKVGSFRIY